MATATQTVTQTEPPAIVKVGEKVQNATSGVLGWVEGTGNWIAAKGKAALDRVISPEQRAGLLAKLQAFMLRNPKLSLPLTLFFWKAFLGMQLALTGVPLFLFVLFTITVGIFAILTGLILGLLGAVLFIVFAVGVALAVVLPIVFFTTMAACFLFLWGLGGFYILKWANGEGANKTAPEGQAIGDKLNNLTGGRLTGFMEAARNEIAKGESSKKNVNGTQQKQKKPNGSVDPTADVQKQANDTVSKATKATGIDGVANTAGTVKGTLTVAIPGTPSKPLAALDLPTIPPPPDLTLPTLQPPNAAAPPGSPTEGPTAVSPARAPALPALPPTPSSQDPLASIVQDRVQDFQSTVQAARTDLQNKVQAAQTDLQNKVQAAQTDLQSKVQAVHGAFQDAGGKLQSGFQDLDRRNKEFLASVTGGAWR